MTSIPPPNFRIRYSMVSVRFNSESKFFIMNPNSLPFQTLGNKTFYIIKEYELGIVSDREVIPERMIQKGSRGDYLFVDVTGNLAIIAKDKARDLLGNW